MLYNIFKSNRLFKNSHSTYRDSYLLVKHRYLCSASDGPQDHRGYFITTPIYYVNANPHIGHLHSSLLGDAAFRFQKLQDSKLENAIFSTGTDEHGLKIQQAAKANNCTPMKFCNDVSNNFRSLFDSTNIGFTDYVRTTEQRHKKTVKQFFSELVERGHIYKGNYSGWYCISDEAFLTESQVKEIQLPSGEKHRVSIESGHPVEWNSETNYMFRLSSFTDDLKHWLKDDNRVKPARYLKDLRMWVDEGLHDLSVSRPRQRVEWGVDVPGDDDSSVYVWVDALVNYLTVAGYPDLQLWPPDVQVLGKDILRFHGIYWPALLMAAGLDPPRTLLCHAHWTVEGEKMSKSKGNVVSPVDRSGRYSSDGLRYFLLREGTLHSDCSWSDVRAVRLLNAELADTLGNLVNRCTAPSLNPSGKRPVLSADYLADLPLAGRELLEKLQSVPDLVAEHYREFNFYRGIDVIMAAVRQANLYVQEEKPWELKNETNRMKLDSVLCIALETAGVAGIALQPIVPQLSSQLLDSLGIPHTERSWSGMRQRIHNLCRAECDGKHSLGPRVKLFKKIKE